MSGVGPVRSEYCFLTISRVTRCAWRALGTAHTSFAQQAEAMKYCKADVARLCPGVQMGGGRIIGCLKEHKMEISVGCAMTLRRMKARMGV